MQCIYAVFPANLILIPLNNLIKVLWEIAIVEIRIIQFSENSSYSSLVIPAFSSASYFQTP
jgi:hypothetical protein